MKRAIVAIIITLLVCSCQEKEEIKRPVDIQGRWYGSLGKLLLSDENERYLMLSMKNGKVSVTPFFTSITSGWYEGEGSYAIDKNNIIRFNISTDIPSFVASHPGVSLKKITHAETYESTASGVLLKVYYEETIDGQMDTHMLYFKRTQP